MLKKLQNVCVELPMIERKTIWTSKGPEKDSNLFQGLFEAFFY